MSHLVCGVGGELEDKDESLDVEMYTSCLSWCVCVGEKIRMDQLM